LHPEVEIKVIVNVARTEEEAERQAAGEDVTKFREEDAEAARAALAAEALFEGASEEEEEADTRGRG
jgi:large subunit ribosomal protein L9